MRCASRNRRRGRGHGEIKAEPAGGGEPKGGVALCARLGNREEEQDLVLWARYIYICYISMCIYIIYALRQHPIGRSSEPSGYATIFINSLID